MKKSCVFILLAACGWFFFGGPAWATDVGWMQKGVRVWYFGGVSSGMSSDAEEAYLINSVNGNSAQVIHHSGSNHWGLQSPADTNTYSLNVQGPFWIHPQVLQTVKAGDAWMGISILSMARITYNSYEDFKNGNSEFASLPYLLLPIKALFDVNPLRNVVKLVYGTPYLDDVWGTAFFDSDTGLCLFNLRLGLLSATTFFILSEINYDFATHTAYAEDSGPHTGFKSSVIKTTVNPLGLIDIESSVETRYGDPIQTFTSTQAGGASSIFPYNENCCFFESVPVLKHIAQTTPPSANYPPENWNDFGEYFWWWVPQAALQRTAINVCGVELARTSTSPVTFAGTGGTGLYFSRIVFDERGYVASFDAKDPAIGLDTGAGTVVDNIVTVSGLDYYLNTMGPAVPEPGSSPAVTVGAASSVGTTSARLNGTVNPNGSATTASFEYGPTTSYGSSASVTLSPNNGSTAQSVSAAISSLQAGTTYHFRLTAANSHGTTTSGDATFKTSSSNDDGDSPDDGGGGGGGGIFGAVDPGDVIGYHLDATAKNGTLIYMPVTEGYKALKGAETHLERIAPGLALLIRKGFESLEGAAEAHKDGLLYRVGTWAFPLLGEIARLYLDLAGSPELMRDAYAGTTIGVEEFESLRRRGIAVCPHVIKGKKGPRQ